jgi:hypothetical protein
MTPKRTENNEPGIVDERQRRRRDGRRHRRDGHHRHDLDPVDGAGDRPVFRFVAGATACLADATPPAGACTAHDICTYTAVLLAPLDAMLMRTNGTAYSAGSTPDGE